MESTPAGCRGAAQSLTLWLFIVLGVLLVAGALSATSLRDLISRTSAPAPAPASSTSTPAVESAATAASSSTQAVETAAPAAAFGLEQLRGVLSVLGEKERTRLLEDEAAFSELVRKERARWAVVEAAKTAGLQTSPRVSYLMQRSAEQVLVDTYVKLNVGAAVPAGFPGEDQIQQFYEQNQARFRVEARIPVWQIYLPVPEQATAAQASEIERRASDLASSLRANNIEFAKAAAEQSAHEASRLNGGFMGNLKVEELIPEIKAAVSEAPVGKILGPVRSASGFHILRCGERIDAIQLPLAQVREQIRTSLRQAAENKAQQLLISRAREQAGGEIGQAQLDRWRAALRPGPP